MSFSRSIWNYGVWIPIGAGATLGLLLAIGLLLATSIRSQMLIFPVLAAVCALGLILSFLYAIGAGCSLLVFPSTSRRYYKAMFIAVPVMGAIFTSFMLGQFEGRIADLRSCEQGPCVPVIVPEAGWWSHIIATVDDWLPGLTVLVLLSTYSFIVVRRLEAIEHETMLLESEKSRIKRPPP